MMPLCSMPSSTSLSSQVRQLSQVSTSQFGLGVMGCPAIWAPSGCGLQGQSRGLPLSCMNAPPKHTHPNSPSRSPPKLCIANDDSNSHVSTDTSNTLIQGSKESTLKCSDFETDSLECCSPISRCCRGEGLAPLVNTGTEQTLASSSLPAAPFPQQSNLMINYANPHSSSTLSPIWNQNELFPDESETSTNFITSPIGQLNHFPNILSPDCMLEEGPGGVDRRCSDAAVQRRCFDLGDHCKESGLRERDASRGGEGRDEGKDDFIIWKRGKLLGRGAYGKVWEGLLSSARMIAVKEVELDMCNLEKAKCVRHVHVM